MAEKHESFEQGNTSSHNCNNGTASRTTSEVVWKSKFVALFRGRLRRSGRNIIATSNPKTAPVESVLPSSSAGKLSMRIERMMRRRSKFATELEFEIDSSRVHWSELESTEPKAGHGLGFRVSDVSTEPKEGHGLGFRVSDVSSKRADEATHVTNSEIVERLRSLWPGTGTFFRDYSDRLVVGAKIAEGGQAEIFEAQYLSSPNGVGPKFVLKVFKEGLSLRDLQRQWPHGMLQQRDLYLSLYSSPIMGGTVVMNGRFAFEMLRRWGDLRTLIDMRMQCNNNQRPPFSKRELLSNMFEIAVGMRNLHKDNIVHRDLKASNVLIGLSGKHWGENKTYVEGLPKDSYFCNVADYECSVGVLGTGFWRAPEILNAVKHRNVTSDLFTQKSDVYSYAMTCYEMVTGQLPFENVRLNDYDIVLRGDRPTLPEHVKPWIKVLLSRCWHQDPLERPNFEEIVSCLTLHKLDK